MSRPRGSRNASVKPCGTRAAYDRHRRRGEEPCDTCKRAVADQARENYAPRSWKGGTYAGVQPCGTPAAYRRHHRHGEEPCEACKKAKAASRKPGGGAS